MNFKEEDLEIFKDTVGNTPEQNNFGISEIDKKINFAHNKLIFITGDITDEKSDLMLTLASNYTFLPQNKAAYFSLNIDKKGLFRKLICKELGSNKDSVYKLKQNNPTKYKNVVNEIINKNLNIYNQFFSIKSIILKIKQENKLHGTKVYFIDYLQLIECEEFFNDRSQQLEKILRELKILTNNLDINIFITANSENNLFLERFDKKFILKDIDPKISQHPDTVLFIYYDEKYNNENDKNIANMIFCKHPNYKKDQIVRLKYFPQINDFSSFEL